MSLPDNNGNAAFMLACKTGDDLCVKELLKYTDRIGLAINHQNHEGNTALHLAYQQKLGSVVQLLLSESSINTSLKNKDGFLAKDIPGNPVVDIPVVDNFSIRYLGRRL